MPTSTQTDLVAAIHSRGCRLVVALTGGGSRAISGLLTVPGASHSVLEAVVPYSPAAMTRWLGARPENFCSERTARAIAMVAFVRAHTLVAESGDAAASVIGLGCTASLASDRPKRGDHRAHLALQTADATVSLSVVLEKGLRSRSDEEDLTAALVLNLAAEAAGVDDRLALPLSTNERIERHETRAQEAWRRLLLGQAAAVRARGGESSAIPRIVFPGAFNPLHDGHRRMAALAAEHLGHEVEFEISISNVDKPPLDYIEIACRLAQFTPIDRVWLTAAPTFVAKAPLFPSATFLVGADTIRRIGDAKYYGGSPQARDAAIGQIAASGCRFLVFGRRADGHFDTLADLDLPADLAALCRQVPESTFRADISSSEIRRHGS